MVKGIKTKMRKQTQAFMAMLTLMFFWGPMLSHGQQCTCQIQNENESFFHVAIEIYFPHEPHNGGVVLVDVNVNCKIFIIGTLRVRMHDAIMRTLTMIQHILEPMQES